jgi:peptide/nickel transport system substrate-binding protein
MRMRLAGLMTLALLLILAFNPPQPVLAKQQIPFDGLKLVYFAETAQVVQERAHIYANSSVILLFHDVSAASSKLDINVNGTLTQNGQQQAKAFNTTVDFPTDRDTLIFLKNGGQDSLMIYAGPSGLTIPSFPGVTLDLTRSWNLHDKPLIRTPIGSFPGYRYHTSITSISIPAGGTLDLDFYASYEMNTQVLMAGEVWATINGASEMVARTELRGTNLLSAQSPSRCLIATATYGSELAAPVQFLREFRDQKIQKTFAGSNFMVAFNLWYYSFSPAVASSIDSSSELRLAMQILLYPLIMILQGSAAIFGALAFQPELGALFGGLFASATIGSFYLCAPSIVICRRYRRSVKRVLKHLTLVLGVGIVGLIIAEVLSNSFLATVSSATIVLANLFVFAGLPSLFKSRRSLIQ